MQNNIISALDHFKNGGLVIVTDDHHRENEGDLILAAEYATPEKINFIIRNTGGVVCLSMTEDYVSKFNLPMMVLDNQATWQTPFTVTIDARYGISTGISAFDRSHTIQLATQENVSADDFVSPGHIFPLKAKPYGVLQRDGHTEAAVDLAKLAGLKPLAVLSELMNEDGSMMRGDQLKNFAQQWQLPILSIAELKQYRLQQEIILQLVASTALPTHHYGNLICDIFYNPVLNEEYIVLRTHDVHNNAFVRIHSACFTGDILSSQRCDCGWQLQEALNMIKKHNGLLIYLAQEGRGIGLVNKIRAYALQENGFDTVTANQHLGFEADLRNYDYCGQILRHYGLDQAQLLTNNPTKIAALQAQGFQVDRTPLIATSTPYNSHYLHTKATMLNHLLSKEPHGL